MGRSIRIDEAAHSVNATLFEELARRALHVSFDQNDPSLDFGLVTAAICLTCSSLSIRQDMRPPCRDLSSIGDGTLTHERREILNQLLPELAEPGISSATTLGRIGEVFALGETPDDQAVAVVVGLDEQFPVDIAACRKGRIFPI